MSVAWNVIKRFRHFFMYHHKKRSIKHGRHSSFFVVHFSLPRTLYWSPSSTWWHLTIEQHNTFPVPLQLAALRHSHPMWAQHMHISVTVIIDRTFNSAVCVRPKGEPTGSIIFLFSSLNYGQMDNNGSKLNCSTFAHKNTSTSLSFRMCWRYSLTSLKYIYSNMYLLIWKY